MSCLFYPVVLLCVFVSQTKQMKMKKIFLSVRCRISSHLHCIVLFTVAELPSAFGEVGVLRLDGLWQCAAVVFRRNSDFLVNEVFKFL